VRELVEEITAIRAGQGPPAPTPTVPAVATAGASSAQEAGSPTLRPAHDLGAAEAESARRQLAEWLRQGVPHIALDFAAVRNIDADGLMVLVRAARAAARRQPPATFHVIRATPEVQTLLRLTRLDGAYPLAGGSP
jgi:anti-anti-sigma factor